MIVSEGGPFDIKASKATIRVSSWDPSAAAVLQITSANDTHDVSVIRQKRLSSIASLTNKHFETSKQVQLADKPWCVRLIEDKLWVCESNGTIELLDTNLKMIRKLENEAWGYVNDVVSVNDNGVAIVTYLGLFHIDSNGSDICIIDYGNYKSGVIHNETLFAYEYLNSSILSYTYDGSWQKKNTIKLVHGIWTTLSVTETTITACNADGCKM